LGDCAGMNTDAMPRTAADFHNEPANGDIRREIEAEASHWDHVADGLFGEERRHAREAAADLRALAWQIPEAMP
jgi:hypothetical protein